MDDKILPRMMILDRSVVFNPRYAPMDSNGRPVFAGTILEDAGFEFELHTLEPEGRLIPKLKGRSRIDALPDGRWLVVQWPQPLSSDVSDGLKEAPHG
jgi:hypothetical protein